ncbi:PREDICTED: spindle assembly abnormal protein 6 homolog isoform X1 [Dipodomys ordii]|uniref:Spindle assembly abnormal protein 6 homolog n=1 Tax=Dipodomys ordii TaxID=10020 RepID=A0A1S3GDR5_DIPOR|nr:PREDICTED: spindle assembly abnormal protein 6 homolog isoform X1 [Dipodomys ordii]XP_012886846.1 PREDICTED: spindle assembly abnormal protein 6 homolog isoform X1 [Dipodomys ordii]
MSQVLFQQIVPLQVKCKDCEERRVSVRVSIELQSVSNPVHRKDLVIRLTDDTDPFFLYNLVISEDDFQSLKFQQGLLVDFLAFPQKFIDLLQQCTQEHAKEIPRFLLQLVSPAAILDNSPVFLNVVETNPFKHLTHLSLKLLPGNDVEIKKFLACCLKCSKEEKLSLTQSLDDVTRQLNSTQKTLSEKIQELEKLRNEWASHTASLTNKHSQELTNEKEKALQAQVQYQQQHEQQKKDLEILHQQNIHQLQSRLSDLEAANKELTERKYKGDSTVRELKAKLSAVEEELQRTKQEVLSLRRENSTLDAECHEKEKHINQLQTKVAVLEQEIKDKDQLVLRTKEAFDTMQEQKVLNFFLNKSVTTLQVVSLNKHKYANYSCLFKNQVALEESGEKNQVQLGKLEATIKSLSTELLKANEIIKKLQGDLKTLMGKLKLKNTVTIQQEKLLAEKEEKLQKEQKELQDVGQSLRVKEQEVCKLQEQLEATVQKLEESKQLLKNNEKLITWLNKELNENQLVRKPDVSGPSTTPSAHASSSTLRSGISPNVNVVDSRLNYPGCGIGYPVSSAFAFQNTFPHPIATKNTIHPVSGPKVQFNLQFTKPDAQSGTTSTMPGSTDKENGENLGLESKYLKKREDSIPLRGLSQNLLSNAEHQKDGTLGALQMSSKPTVLPSTSAYFPGQLPSS